MDIINNFVRQMAKIDEYLRIIEALAPEVASAAGVREAFIRALNNGYREVRVAVIRALAPLASTDSEIRDKILERMDDQEELVQVVAIEALAPLAASDDRVRDKLLEIVKGGKEDDEFSALKKDMLDAVKDADNAD